MPYKYPPRSATYTIYVAVEYRDDWERLAALAQRAGRSLSRLVSEAVREKLERDQ